jgi:hypothetical protein
VLDGTSFVPEPRSVGHRKDSRVSQKQGHIEEWTALVFLGLAVASALAAAASRGWVLWRPQA